MKLSKLIPFAFAIITVIAFATAATASAETETEPNLLPEASAKAPITFTGETLGELEIVFAGLEPIKCKTAPSTGEFTTPKTGLGILEILGCHTPLAGCIGLEKGEPSEHIKVHAELDLLEGWLVNSSGVLERHLVVFVLLMLHVHFICGGIVLVLILGCVAGLIKEINILVSKLTSELKESAKKEKMNDITLIGKGTELKACELKVAVNEGKEGAVLLIGTWDLKAFKQVGKEITVLLMA